MVSCALIWAHHPVCIEMRSASISIPLFLALDSPSVMHLPKTSRTLQNSSLFTCARIKPHHIPAAPLSQMARPATLCKFEQSPTLDRSFFLVLCPVHCVFPFFPPTTLHLPQPQLPAVANTPPPSSPNSSAESRSAQTVSAPPWPSTAHTTGATASTLCSSSPKSSCSRPASTPPTYATHLPDPSTLPIAIPPVFPKELTPTFHLRHFASQLLLLALFNRATGTTASITDQIFNHTFVTLRHFPGWVTCTALLVSAAGPTALAFVAIVGRAKRCVDFACTLLISHIIATTIHSGFPKSLMWWLLNIVATAALATVGEALSLRIELREIAVRGDAPTSASVQEQPQRRGMFERKTETVRPDDIESGLRDAAEGSSAGNGDIEKTSLMQAS